MAYTTIDDPTAYFQTTLFVGNQTARSITFDGNTNMQPDLVWIKPRDNGAWSHNLTDSVRGAGYGIFTDLTGAQYSKQQMGVKLYTKEDLKNIWGNYKLMKKDDTGKYIGGTEYTAKLRKF